MRAGGLGIELEERAEGLAEPTAIAAPADGSGRLFVAEKAGLVRWLPAAGGLAATPFLDITALVLDDTFERGLAGLAFHPDYASNGLFYVAYTEPTGASVVASYRVSANPSLADPGTATILLTVPQPAPIHNVNQLAFGPDGYLYVASGDGGPAFDPDGNAQNLGLLLGKLLRIDVDHADPPLAYRIPASNPFAGTPGARPEIWAYGLRNPSRFSFDRASGDLWIGDVGQASWEEVDRQPAGSVGGENYGWRLLEGNHCFPPTAPSCDPTGLVPPVLEYAHGGGNCAVIGGYRYRGTLAPGLSGTYVFGDFCSGRVWGATQRCGGSWRATELFSGGPPLSAFGEDEAGELTVVEWALGGARLYRIASEEASELGADSFEAGDLLAWQGCAGESP